MRGVVAVKYAMIAPKIKNMKPIRRTNTSILSVVLEPFKSVFLFYLSTK